MSNVWRVLCVDDDAGMAANVAETFQSWSKDSPGSFAVEVETSIKKASDRLSKERFDLVTLDLHDSQDPDPSDEDVSASTQAGEVALEKIRQTRFVPVIFYTGFAAKVADLESPIVKVVTKGNDDVKALRSAASAIFSTRLPKLLRLIEAEQRSFMWDTLASQWARYKDEISPEELAYLLARRVAQQLSRETIKTAMEHTIDEARPIEMYVYPPPSGVIFPGDIIRDSQEQLWIVVTPACDFAQKKTETVLMCSIVPLNKHPVFVDWQSARNKDNENKLRRLLRNSGGDRWRFLPETFFLAAGVVDFQRLQQIPLNDIEGFHRVCTLDSPYSEDLLLAFSRYYGRLGTPDFRPEGIWESVLRLAGPAAPVVVKK